MKKIVLIFLLTCIAFLFSSCAHVVPRELRSQVDVALTPEMIFKDPEAHRGKTVMLGGLILSTANTKDATYIEILERPLDSRGRPEDTELSRGRFMIKYEGYLDPAIYTKGKLITAVGELSGIIPGKIGEMEYKYPLIVSKNLYLFEKSREIPVRFGIGIFKSF
ncbi:MAG: Slp family lipoprotein [Thermodesulfovibrionales bacterium]|nr:Slp family lipoprotein [Thermodesulfovibrionales bacterium]